ncbi:prepilin peptidase [Candidatus Woesebacteria bacterium]|nr:prepilin peptidase [Candidatus Woesebacteria bacterium]
MIIQLGFVFVIGLFFGSFLNVLADRLPRGETILGRSKCESCKHELAWNDLIPIISYILLRGRCRYCKKHFSIQYVFVEIGTAIIFTLTHYFSITHYYIVGASVLHLILVSIWIAMLLSDLRYFILPDSLQGAAFVTAVIHSILIVPSWHFTLEFVSISTFLLSLSSIPLVAGIIVALPIYLLYIVTKGKGMGFGDVKLAFVLGVLLGPWQGLLSLYLASIFGGSVALIFLALRKAHLKSKIPFGPFLILGGYIMLFFGPYIIAQYMYIYF